MYGGLQPGHHGLQKEYTVPIIKHIPTDRYITDSAAIAQFLESTYPNPCVPLTSSLGDQVEARLPSVLGTAFKTSLIPRQSLILSPQARNYFNSTREANLGHPIMDLLEGDGEEKAWATAAEDIRAIGEMILTKKADGPFLLGENPSYTDFVIVGYLQCARTVNEGVFQRLVQNPGLRTVYNACLPLIVLKKD